MDRFPVCLRPCRCRQQHVTTSERWTTERGVCPAFDPAAALHFLVPFGAQTLPAAAAGQRPDSLPHTFVGVDTASPPTHSLPSYRSDNSTSTSRFSKNNLIKLALFLERKNERRSLDDRIRYDRRKRMDSFSMSKPMFLLFVPFLSTNAFHTFPIYFMFQSSTEN